MPAPVLVIHEIGARGHLTQAVAAVAAGNFARLLAFFPHRRHMLVIAGYDADPRELWDCPEVRDFVTAFFLEVVRLLPGATLEAWRLDEASIGLLLMCTGAGRIIGRDPETGVYTIAGP